MIYSVNYRLYVAENNAPLVLAILGQDKLSTCTILLKSSRISNMKYLQLLTGPVILNVFPKICQFTQIKEPSQWYIKIWYHWAKRLKVAKSQQRLASLYLGIKTTNEVKKHYIIRRFENCFSIVLNNFTYQSIVLHVKKNYWVDYSCGNLEQTPWDYPDIRMVFSTLIKNNQNGGNLPMCLQNHHLNQQYIRK